MSICNIVFKEMMKNQDDLDLFLELRYGYDLFFRDICIEFINETLVKALERRIADYNHKHPERNTSLKKPFHQAACLETDLDGHLIITSDYWPKYYSVVFGSDSWGLNKMYAALRLTAPETLAAETGSKLRDKFKEISCSKWCAYNKHMAWFHFKEPLLRLLHGGHDSAKGVFADVIASQRSDIAPNGSFAECYANSLMELVVIVDDLVGKSEANLIS